MKIFCIGRNYLAHIEELENEKPDQPLIFMKPSTALLREAKPFFIPDFSSDIHFECEWVVRIAKHGKAISTEFALDYIDTMTLGIDFTARDIQSDLKEKGQPWEIAKAFDYSAAIGQWLPFDPKAAFHEFSLNKNGTEVQHGDTRHMMFTLPEIIAYLSRFFTLQKGDLIFTGTPAGVGPVQKGDVLAGTLNGEQVLKCSIK
jgi:2-keto-4-pentenoate hydratase/2-oxohepta-3-ene-1,7-dioic acid hydratase in catechol pathway